MMSYSRRKEPNLTLQPKFAKFMRDTVTFGKMSPYVKAQLGNQSIQTSVHVNGGKFPRWRKEDVLKFVWTTEKQIDIEVWSKGKGKKDDLIGSTKFDLSQLVLNQVFDNWISFNYKEKKIGEVKIEFQYSQNYQNNPQPQSNQQFSQIANSFGRGIIQQIMQPTNQTFQPQKYPIVYGNNNQQSGITQQQMMGKTAYTQLQYPQAYYQNSIQNPQAQFSQPYYPQYSYPQAPQQFLQPQNIQPQMIQTQFQPANTQGQPKQAFSSFNQPGQNQNTSAQTQISNPQYPQYQYQNIASTQSTFQNPNMAIQGLNQNQLKKSNEFCPFEQDQKASQQSIPLNQGIPSQQVQQNLTVIEPPPYFNADQPFVQSSVKSRPSAPEM